MSLVRSLRDAYGGLSIYDVTSRVNLSKLRPAFERLQVDPYIREGYRRKHIGWFKKEHRGYLHLPESTLFQAKQFNPVHGDVARVYPPLEAHTPDVARVILRTLELFDDVVEDGVPAGARILFQMQRVTAAPGRDGKPSVEDWHRDGVKKIGIICVGRENIVGGLSQFRNGASQTQQRRRTRPRPSSKTLHGNDDGDDDDEDDVYTLELSPGHMAVFDDASVLHRVTDISSADGRNEGARDVILLSF